MKSIYRCTECKTYTLHDEACTKCGQKVKHPYPARFSIIKEKKYRKYIKK